MMLRAALFVGLIVAGTVITGAWLSRLPLPASPDLVLLVVLAAAMRRGVETGVADAILDALQPLGVVHGHSLDPSGRRITGRP